MGEKKRGLLSRVKSTPKEEGGGDKSELEECFACSSYASHSAGRGPRAQQHFVHRTIIYYIRTYALFIYYNILNFINNE